MKKKYYSLKNSNESQLINSSRDDCKLDTTDMCMLCGSEASSF